MATVCITGANRGIGLELARHYKVRGDRVIAVCRSASKDLKALGVDLSEGVDVTIDDSVTGFVAELADTRVDLLINNAGLLSDESLVDLDFDRMRRQFEVNTLGPLRMTAAVAPNLGEGSKVAIISSRMGSIQDNTSGGRYGYRMSKCAANMAGRSLAHDLKDSGVAVAILHPGFVRTEMTGGQGLIDSPESAAGLMARIDELTLETTGTFWHVNGEVIPW